MTLTVIDLLDAVRAHLGAFDLSAPCSAHLTTYPGGPSVNMQITCRDARATTAGLLAWADTLTGITAEAWRAPTGNSVHLSVTGHLPDGMSLRIYGAVPYTEHGPGADLAPNAAITIPLATLRHQATDTEGTH